MSKEPSSSVGTKRKASEQTKEVPAKVPKIHPFFAKKPKHSEQETQTGPFKWLDPLGPKRTCLHGVNLNPKASEKVAALDLDGTLIKSSFGTSNSTHWEWWRPSVPAKLRQLHQDGFSILIISNQAIKPGPLKQWQLKIPLIAAALPDIPFRIFAAKSKDVYRKPMIGMWTELVQLFREENVEIDKTSSFFVGDAAGRQYDSGKPDFAGTDRKWALNVGIPFQTPEEFFLGLPLHTNCRLDGFDVTSLPSNLPRVTPTSSPLLPDPPRQEIVLFVGYPCLGKSTFFRQHFQPAGYTHVNQDTLGSRPKCIKAVQSALDEGNSCVVDNTNRDVATRKHYIDLGKKANVPVRCISFAGSFELAWHNNLYRAFNLPPSVAEKEPRRELLPYGALTGFRDAFEDPTLSEGFSEIKTVNWTFEGTEEEKKYWSMWLQLDGK